MSEPIKTLETVMRELRESRAHTYASENAGLYRGFDNGQKRAADSLQPVRDALWGLVDEWRDGVANAPQAGGGPHRAIGALNRYQRKMLERCADELAAILGEREG